ncbi:MAG: class I SAM-dependent methyltransferase [Melioribacteraceae bacterium]|nr:class I SAM-dependent methyltransferase [Melioribacteraceae bacterium]
MKDKWDERFANKEYMYGKDPNKFFKQEIDKLTPGKALFIGEGEGRNAVYAATLGWQVDAVDWSENARKKAISLAIDKNTTINYYLSAFNDLTIREDYYDLIVFIFIHEEPDLREKLHSLALKGLKKGGVIILEAYEKEQLKFKSGGPKNPEMLYSLEDIYNDFNELSISHFSKEIISQQEGFIHNGNAAVIQYVGTKD